MVYLRWWRWWYGDMRLLVPYTKGWLFKFGKKPYNLLAVVLFFTGIVLATISWAMCPLFRKPPVMPGWFVRPTHRFMRGKKPWRTMK